ncbi:MAG: type 3 dihydrofolate reductase [Alishewanella aestuarii]|uniref:type 3 dihydrofolate reductase n=1 Tax=Alishewanella sp. BS5-314 TaxID=2755587 RepID=UPI0021BA3EE4|nr:type 3 dihydrofolate reductase [Alishewanella sp. BS5-314]MCT8124873.1 type 3 dihydrofolate reductase [Alishewanella sp. BS5-314]
MRISMIAAMAQQRVIGLNNQMPWHLPADLQHFKKVTLGKPVVMGRKTFESIGRPLPGRRNIVISRQTPAVDSPVEWVSSIEQALALLAEQPEVMIIGGAEIYRQCLPLAQRLYLTEIALETAGDAFFPDYHAEGNWQEIAREEHPQSAENPLGYRFITLERQ